jgi:hypothetical protein
MRKIEKLSETEEKKRMKTSSLTLVHTSAAAGYAKGGGIWLLVF